MPDDDLPYLTRLTLRLIDGVEKLSVSGAVTWQTTSFPISAGTHVLKWAYVKDVTNSIGSDGAIRVEGSVGIERRMIHSAQPTIFLLWKLEGSDNSLRISRASFAPASTW